MNMTTQAKFYKLVIRLLLFIAFGMGNGTRDRAHLIADAGDLLKELGE